MTIEILEDLLKHCRKNGIRLPVIVFADGYKGHYGLEIAEFCAQNQIKMIFLKPNTTHACQPLDVTCFSPLKALIKKLSHEWHGKPENTNRKLDKYSVMKEVTYQAIEKVFSNPKTVPSGFRRSGLLPFGPENMDWEKFSSSQVYERPGRRDEQSVNNNNNNSTAPEFCGNAVDVADPAFRPHPLPLVTTDPLLSPLSPLPRVCEEPHEDTPPANLDIEDVDHVEYLLKTRENLQYKDLTQKPAPAMVYTEVGKSMPGILKPLGDKLQEKDIFNTWMLKEQDLIQASVCEAPTVPNTPLVTPQSSVSGPPPPANNDTDPLIEPLLALPVSAVYSAQASSAPVSAPPISLTISAPIPATATTSDVGSPEDLANRLVTKQNSLSYDKKVRQLQRYEHLIDPDGDKVAEFESLYKAAKFDVANTEFQVWLLYKQQAVGTEAEAFNRILEKKIPKNVQRSKRKRKDNLPPGKDRYDLTSTPMIQSLRDMEDRAENRSSKKIRTSKPATITSSSINDTNGNSKAKVHEDSIQEKAIEKSTAVPATTEEVTKKTSSKKSKKGTKESELEFSDGFHQSETRICRGRRQRHQQPCLAGDGGGLTSGQHQPRILQEDVSRGRGAGGGGAQGVHEVAALPYQAEHHPGQDQEHQHHHKAPDAEQAVLHVLQQVRQVHQENKSSKKLRTSKPASSTITSSINDTNGNLKAKVQEESIQEKVIETPSEPLQEMDVNKSTEVPATTEKVTKKSCSKTSKRGAKESSVGDSMKAAFCDEISSPTQTSSVQAPPVQVEVSTNVLPLDVPTKSKKRRKKKDVAVATRIMTRKTRKAFQDL